jgi:transcriptional regulator with XRE-family HTH domain
VNIKDLGKRLTKYREDAGFTMEGLALESGVAKNAILALEKGRGNPTIKTLEALSKALGIQIQALIGDAPAKPSQAHGMLQEAARMLTAMALASAPRRALILALIYRDESYLDALPREVGHAARVLGKVP